MAYKPDEELRQWLVNHLKINPNLRSALLSRTDRIGASRTAIDAYIDKRYFAPKEEGGFGVTSSKLEAKIRAYRERVEQGAIEEEKKALEQVIRVPTGGMTYRFLDEHGECLSVLYFNPGKQVVISTPKPQDVSVRSLLSAVARAFHSRLDRAK